MPSDHEAGAAIIERIVTERNQRIVFRPDNWLCQFCGERVPVADREKHLSTVHEKE